MKEMIFIRFNHNAHSVISSHDIISFVGKRVQNTAVYIQTSEYVQSISTKSSEINNFASVRKEL